MTSHLNNNGINECEMNSDYCTSGFNEQFYTNIFNSERNSLNNAPVNQTKDNNNNNENNDNNDNCSKKYISSHQLMINHHTYYHHHYHYSNEPVHGHPNTLNYGYNHNHHHFVNGEQPYDYNLPADNNLQIYAKNSGNVFHCSSSSYSNSAVHDEYSPGQQSLNDFYSTFNPKNSYANQHYTISANNVNVNPSTQFSFRTTSDLSSSSSSSLSNLSSCSFTMFGTGSGAMNHSNSFSKNSFCSLGSFQLII